MELKVDYIREPSVGCGTVGKTVASKARDLPVQIPVIALCGNNTSNPVIFPTVFLTSL